MLGPLPRIAVPDEEPAVELLVAVADDVGLDDDLVATDPLDGEPAAVDLGHDAVDGHAVDRVGGELGLSIGHGAGSRRGWGRRRRQAGTAATV